MKVLVTGAAGFLGLNIVRVLQETGHSVRAYIRASSDSTYLQAFGCAQSIGELTDSVAVTEAMKDVDAVIHTAGNTSCFWRDYPQLHATNVAGTETLVQCARQAGVGRFIYTSSISTVGAPDSRDQRGDESTPLTGLRANSPYALTKRKAEILVREAGEEAAVGGMTTIILNPAYILGPYDHKLQVGRLLLAVCKGELAVEPPGGSSFCSAEAVAEAHVTALSGGRSGERYVLSCEDASFRQLIQMAADWAGVESPSPRVPYQLAVAIAQLREWVHPLASGRDMVEPFRLRVGAGHYYFCSDKARRELGYVRRPLIDTVRQSLEWYRAHGYVEVAR